MNEASYGYRRAYKRFSCFLSGTCESSNNKVHEISCNDISYKGAGFLVESPLAINSHLKIRLSNVKIDSMEIEGTVRWCKNFYGKWRAGVLLNRDLPFNLEKII